MYKPIHTILCFVLTLVLLAPSVKADADIKVVYPKSNQRIGAIDSTFIFGSVNPGWEVEVNGQEVAVHAGGGWIAFLPLVAGDFVFEISARKENDSSALSWPVRVPGEEFVGDVDSLVIFPDYRLPVSSRSVAVGEVMRFQFRGTAGCRAWVEIVGVVDSIPCSEAGTIPLPYHAGDVFDSATSEIDSSLTLPGVYQGMYRISSQTNIDSVNIVYHLSGPSFDELSYWISSSGVMGVDVSLLRGIDWRLARYADSVVSDTSVVQLTLNTDLYPRTVEFTDTAQRLRVAPSRGYLGLFQPAGVRAMAVGFEGDWYKLKLSATRFGFVEFDKAKQLKKGILPPHSRLSSFRCESGDDGLAIRAQLSGMHPYSISEPDSRTMVVEIFGVTMDTDWFRFDYRDSMLTAVTWTQPEPGLFRLELRFSQPLWGYSAGYAGNVFELIISHPPDGVNSLHGKKIVIDPGHNPDPGSIGPTGLTEAEANLEISLVLREELKRLGAEVVMTRVGDEGLKLYDRPKIADSVEADLFVSVHNNALPDGTNPFVNYGVSTYFYHTHSQALAKAIHEKMIGLPDQKDHGFYHGNLAVLRPTERPSALVECGFMILPEQEAWLKTDSYRRRVAKAIAQGIDEFFRQYGKN